MKNYYIIGILLLSQLLFAQKKAIDTLEYERVYIEVGQVIPLGKLKAQFDNSVAFGFWFRNRIIKNDFADFGLTCFIPNNAKNLSVRVKDTVLSYKSERFAMNIGVRFSKVLPFSNKSKNTNVEWNSGFGAAMIFYEAPNDFEFDKKYGKQETLVTFFVSQGFKLNYKNVGFQIHYQYAPYPLLLRYHSSNYGSQSLLVGLVYRQ